MKSVSCLKGCVLLLLLFTSSALHAADGGIDPITSDLPAKIEHPTVKQDPSRVLDHLIEVSENNLKAQKELKQLLENYQAKRTLFLASKNSAQHTQGLVTAAHRVYSQIQDNHLASLFEPDFLEEIAMFSQIAVKNRWVKS